MIEPPVCIGVPCRGSLERRETPRISPAHCVPATRVGHDPDQTGSAPPGAAVPATPGLNPARALKKKVKPAGKPGSVTGIAPYDGHSSRPWVAPGLQPPTRGLERATHSMPVARMQRPPIWCCSGWRLPRFTRRHCLGGDSSLWPYSSSSPKASPRLVRTAVSRHPALRSPDFPLRTRKYAATVWPASPGNFSTRRCRARLFPGNRPRFDGDGAG